MCGRFTLRTPMSELVGEFELESLPLFRPRYNIAPTQPLAAVRLDADTGRRQFALLRWGLVPSWADDLKIGNRMINARGETVAEKPAFRAAFRRRRCIVMADGYYEWQTLGRKKQPYYFHLKGGEPFGFAGLWESWTSGDGSPVETCSLITTEANEFTRAYHDRMPVILDHSTYQPWLDPTALPPALQTLIRPYPSDRLAAHPVSTLVNSPAHDSEECVAPA